MNSVNATGGSISTRIRQAVFDPVNVEAYMYMGSKLTSLYGREIKKATWDQIFWKSLGSNTCRGGDDVEFYINGVSTGMQLMDYLLAMALEAVFPEVTLANTPAPVPYNVWFRDTPVDSNLLSDLDNSSLYYYLSDGRNGLSDGVLYVGTEAALQSMVPSAPVENEQSTDRISGVIRPFVSHSPRHRVAWSNHALLAAIEKLSFVIGDVAYEELDRHALYNALQFRMRQDVYPVAGVEATTPSVNMATAGVGDDDNVVLGAPSTDDRYKAFVAPFSFTASALSDRSDSGNHRSAFPVLLACGENIKVRVSVVDDIRKTLVLEEEVMEDLSCAPMVFVATADELNDGEVSYMHISNGKGFFTVNVNDSFKQVGSTAALATLEEYTVLNNTVTPGEAITYSPSNRMKLGTLGVSYLVSTGDYHPVTRPTEYNLENPFSRDVDYRKWFSGGDLNLLIKGKALGAKATSLEAGMMKADCRNKVYLYEKYTYPCHSTLVKPGDKVCLDVGAIGGNFKYAYLFAQNELSRLQGNWFNYTNDTDYTRDDSGLVPLFEFGGKSAIERSDISVWGNSDGETEYLFHRYVDNPIFAQRAPRETGLSIVPRYSNWINSINPDGGVNARGISDMDITVKTSRSGLLSNKKHPEYDKHSTYGYNVQMIAVSWGIMKFELEKGCNAN